MIKDLSDVIYFLKLTAIWFDFTGNRFANIKKGLQYSRIFINISTWFTAIIGIYIEGFTTSFDGKYYFIVIMFLCWCHSLDFCIKRKKAEKIINNFQELIKTQNDITQVILFEKDTKRMWAAIKMYALILFTFAAIYFISPVIIDIFIAIYSPDSKIFKVPFCLDGFMDDSVRNWKYYLVVVFGCVWAIENMVTNIGSIGTLCIFVSYLGSQIKILAQKVDKFSADVTKRNAVDNFALTTEDTNTLKDIAKHHIAILSLTEQIREYFGFSYANQNLIASICLCITMISSINLLNNYQYFLVATNLACCYIVVVLVFGACFLGEYLHTQNNYLYYVVCNIPWYALNPKTRKDINLMILVASKERGIHFHNLSALKLHTFMQIMHTAYSYFMVLQSML